MTSCRDGLSVTSGAAWAQSAATHVCPLYIAGLIEPGDGKSVRPMAERMAPGDHDQFHHVIASGILETRGRRRTSLRYTPTSC